ncbi:MAG: DUF3313 domain-containing protein [Burkholderiaceae bacterium]|nr:DUF3313 domain-containing protein [Burkholderiaceae bacterium]
MSTLRVLTASALAFLIGGCAAPTLKAPGDYPQLTVDASDDSILVFTQPGLDLSGFRKVLVEPVRMQARAGGKDEPVTTKEAQLIAEYLRTTVSGRLGKEFTLVDAPAADVLRIRFTVTDLQPTGAAQILMLVPPFSTVNLVSPKGAFTGSITLGGEFFEGAAPQASAAFLVYRSRPGIDATVAFGRLDAAKKVIDNFAERLAKDLAALRKKS